MRGACGAAFAERGALPVIPNNPTRKHPNPFDATLHKRRTIIERMFCRLKDRRRIATRYDKRADNFASAPPPRRRPQLTVLSETRP